MSSSRRHAGPIQLLPILLNNAIFIVTVNPQLLNAHAYARHRFPVRLIADIALDVVRPTPNIVQR